VKESNELKTLSGEEEAEKLLGGFKVVQRLKVRGKEGTEKGKSVSGDQ